MTEPRPRTVRWGIMGPGGIARTFTRNLLQRPQASPAPVDIIHAVTAVASSTSLTTAQSFIDKNIAPHQPSTPCAPHDSYISLVHSSTVDVIYIATPHSSHFRNAMLALTNDKPVLVEKPICVNAAQAELLIRTARERGLFLMEAVWTRFFPISLYVQDVVRQGMIGEVLRVSADFSMGCGDVEGLEEMFGRGGENRMVNPKLAGGVLLDLGVYSLTWVFMCVYHLLPLHLRRAPDVAGAVMTPYNLCVAPSNSTALPSGQPWIDASTTLLVTLPSPPSGTSTCHAVVTTSLYTNTDPGYGGDNPHNAHAHRHSTPSLRIQGTNGEIQLFGPLPRPQRARTFTRVESREGSKADTVTPGNIVPPPSDSGGFRVEDKIFESPGDGNGMYWEADEAARCLRDGKVESAIMPWDETLAVMEVMDQARRRCGLDYGAEVEGLDWA